jgi:hypothetical protein
VLLAQEVSPRFRNVAEEAGVARLLTYGGVGEKRYILETTGPGPHFSTTMRILTWIFVVDGRRSSARGRGEPPLPKRRRGAIRRRDEASGLSRQGWGQGSILDVDNDGDPDLLVTYFGAAPYRKPRRRDVRRVR